MFQRFFIFLPWKTVEIVRVLQVSCSNNNRTKKETAGTRSRRFPLHPKKSCKESPCFIEDISIYNKSRIFSIVSLTPAICNCPTRKHAVPLHTLQNPKVKWIYPGNYVAEVQQEIIKDHLLNHSVPSGNCEGPDPEQQNPARKSQSTTHKPFRTSAEPFLDGYLRFPGGSEWFLCGVAQFPDDPDWLVPCHFGQKHNSRPFNEENIL